MKKLKENTFLCFSDKAKKAIVYDMFNCKKYEMPYEIAKKISLGNATNQDFDIINNIICDDIDDIPTFQNKKLNHLRLLVTNRCNFQCTYCFADHGSYKLDPYDMSYETAKQTIDYFFNNYDIIKSLSFFGGEPLLAIGVIEFICRYISENYPSKIPKYSLVTNGSLLSDDIVKLLQKYNIGIIISHDGPKHIHDKQRITAHGQGTYDLVSEKIKQYKSMLSISIETTYSLVHEDNGMSRRELVSFFTNEFGIDRIILNDVETEPRQQINNTPKTFGELEQVQNLFIDRKYKFTDETYFLTRSYLLGKYTHQFCDADIYHYCIDMYGNIYPCHRFVGKRECIIGNIKKSRLPSGYSDIETKDNKQCQKCRYKLFCRRCFYSMKFVNPECNIIKQKVDLYLNLVLCLMMEDPDGYKNFIQSFNEYGKNHRI